ncbi:MAG: hypothetical protein IKP62_00580 [Salinivirgaceae bacterium]|nr:hypothetical protein [Salinivirgaceae bacterium]
MNSKLLKLILILLVVLPFSGQAQTNDYSMRRCWGYHKDSCKVSKNIYYRVVEGSRSALFVKGQTSRISTTIYNGRDYRISFCHDQVLGSEIVMRIIDAENGNTLYDNTEDGFSSDFEFTVTQTREIYIEISVPGKSRYSEAADDADLVFVRKDTEMGCIGILIEHMITPVKGF